ncbi:LysM peptidoglycan-binding domain-containing protein [Streptomyces sp. RB6PN25]|uniref:LysM peptidoglycan-binding domain-containing protein n=1 Tax=Streptomyces humicola TaxID=2953240 RepID=A0ABT1PU68_9ACTN|nr:transglycosylase family protein [Streptomyces humicola]MCQ4080515.1 LysM peptidoglycan-binding domain-containing protein [Streptomyces humicola]
MAKHRRASKAVRFATLAGITGAAIAAPLMTATSANAATQSQWDAVAQCESGGNWSINTGNGFFGGLQFTSSTWAAYGGTQFAPEANQATESQQIQIAEKVLASQGKGAWPVCGTGLTGAPYAGSSSSSAGSSSSASSSSAASQDNTDNNASAQTESTAPARTAPAAPAPAAPSYKGHGSYTVKSGDTLSGIAAAHHISGGWKKLFQLNKDVVKDANLIYPGQHLRLG